MNISAISLSAALVPAIVFAIIIWWLLQRRCRTIATVVFVLGGVGSFIVGTVISRVVAEVGLTSEESTLRGAATEAFFGAAFPEEVARVLVLIAFCALFKCWRRRNEVVQHAALIGLGFAAVENVFYSLTSTDFEVWFRIVPTLSHGFDGAIMGALLAHSAHSGTRRWLWAILALGVPMLLHFLFDFGQFGLEALGPAIETLDDDAEPTRETVVLVVAALILMSLPLMVWLIEAVAAVMIVYRLRVRSHSPVTAVS